MRQSVLLFINPVPVGGCSPQFAFSLIFFQFCWWPDPNSHSATSVARPKTSVDDLIINQLQAIFSELHINAKKMAACREALK